jgi:hypothetical protein
MLSEHVKTEAETHLITHNDMTYYIQMVQYRAVTLQEAFLYCTSIQ